MPGVVPVQPAEDGCSAGAGVYGGDATPGSYTPVGFTKEEPSHLGFKVKFRQALRTLGIDVPDPEHASDFLGTTTAFLLTFLALAYAAVMGILSDKLPLTNPPWTGSSSSALPRLCWRF